MRLTLTDPAIALSVIEAAAQADGHPPLSEHKVRGLHGEVAARWGAGEFEGVIAAVGVAAERLHDDGSSHWTLEVAVHPAFRAGHHERRAIEVLGDLVPAGSGHTLWTFRDEQYEAAQALGFREIRRVVRMERTLPAAVPDTIGSVVIRPVVLPDEADGLAAVNNRAFAGHRENSAMTAVSITGLAGTSWFDPAGLLVAEEAGTLIGFCWTKVHPAGQGEIYIIGVDPDHHGRGLGRALVTSGLSYLHDERGCDRGFLWTDGDNEGALRLYEGLDFAATLVNRELGQPNG